MYFLLHLLLHKRQALSPIEEKPIQQRKSTTHLAPKGILRAHNPKRNHRTTAPKGITVPAAQKGSCAPSVPQEILHTAASKEIAAL